MPLKNAGQQISTHTPVRVWPRRCKTWSGICQFQLTHPWGCDGYSWTSTSHPQQFQLTHPWGCDNNVLIILPFGNNFNSHTREGVTLENSPALCVAAYISTHTPVRVWPLSGYINELTLNFNSHTREGVTLSYSRQTNLFFISTHTPVRVWHS